MVKFRMKIQKRGTGGYKLGKVERECLIFSMAFNPAPISSPLSTIAVLITDNDAP